MNVFKKHKQRVEAQEAAKAASNSEAAPSSVAEQMAAQMRAHKNELKAIKSRKAQDERKGELLPEYQAYIDGVLAAETGVQDDTVMTAMIWSLDAGIFADAIIIAEWAIENGLDTPPEFKRDVQTLVADSITDTVLSNRDKIEDFTDDLNDLVAVIGGSDIPDEVSAKLFKALSWASAKDDPRKALFNAETALSYDDKCGVKQDIKALKKVIAGLDDAGNSNDSNDN